MMRKLLYSFLLFFLTYYSFGQSTFVDNTPGTGKTWTIPAGVTSITVEIWGAGGAGGGAISSRGGAGGGGGAFSSRTFSVSPGRSVTYDVGSGGTGVNGLGNDGTNSRLVYTPTSTTLIAGGGKGGEAGATLGSNGGDGGVASGGATNTSGANGSDTFLNPGNGAAGGAGANGGAGGNGRGSNGTGNSGGIPGGGGGGARGNNNIGGAGGNGRVRITYTPDGTYRSQIISIDAGTAPWCPGETRNVTVQVRNIGTATWTDGVAFTAVADINIGIRWNSSADNWGDYFLRVNAGNLGPNQTGTYTFSVTASNNNGTAYTTTLAPGSNNLICDVVYEGVSWFAGNGNGVGPGNIISTSSAITILGAPNNSRTIGVSSSPICAGNGSLITVAASEVGVSYQLRNGTTNVGAAVAGTGGTISLPTGSLTATTTFNVLGTSCGNSVQMATTPTVTVNPLPTTSNAGPDQSGNAPFTLAANSPLNGAGAWTIVSGPNNSLSQFSSTTSPTATFNPIGSGTYTLRWTISNGCGNSPDDVVLTVNCVSNLIKNGNFNNGAADWSAATAGGTAYSEVLTEGIYFSNGSPNNTAELDSEASLRQSVTVIPNTTYTLSFIYARRPGSEANVGVTARILSGTTTLSSVSYTTNNTTSAVFVGSLTFTTGATISTIFVELYNTLSTTTLGSIVDNIVLTPSPVAPLATTIPKGTFGTLSSICAGTPVQLDVDNVPASGVTYSWSSSSPGAVFSSTTIKNPTVTFASTLTGRQEVTVVVTPTTGCAGAPSSTYVSLIAAPAVYNVTGGTTTCFGTGVIVGLSGSSTNVSYRLQLNGVNDGAAVTGTGSAINFGTKTAAGTYTVIATNTASNSCSLAMSGNAIIKAIQATPNVASFINIDCVNSTGTIRLENLPSGAWTINQTGQATATLTGSGTPYDVTGLAAGDYTFTVQTATTCASNSVLQRIDDASTSTWNGASWTGGAPTSTKRIIIASNTGTPFPVGTPVVNGCSLTVNAGINVIVPSGVTLVITNAVTTNGQLTFRSGSSLMQTTNATNTGQINYERTTNVRRYDATYWSMPVTNASFRMNTLSPQTLNDKYFTFDPNSTWVVNLNGILPMEVGNGYSIRAPQPYDINTPAPFTGVFVGIPNNGDINPTVVQDKYNLVGNPYPSAISATALINGNTNLGTLYFWTHNSSPVYNPIDGRSYYNNADFAAFNLSGSTGASLSGQPFQGFIAAGQGFLAAPKTPTLNFTNTMRRSSNNSQFYKTGKSEESDELERNRVWLNLSNDYGAFKQVLVGYIEGATNSFDINYDAGTLGSNSSADFYSINESNYLTIQGRALPFDNKEIIPLGYKVATAGDYTIAIDHADGLFDTQEVYLEDLVTAKTVNLRTENYKFTTAIGTFTKRFNLRYTSKTLGTGEFDDLENSVVVSAKNKVVKITSSKETLKNVNIYNVGAQVLYAKDNINSSELQISNLSSGDQVLLVKITLENGHTFTKKVIYSTL